MLNIDDIKRAVNVVAPNYSVKSVKLFGSYANGNASPKSDVDLIISKIRPFTLIDLCAFKNELEERLTSKVDIITEATAKTGEIIIDRTIDLYEK